MYRPAIALCISLGLVASPAFSAAIGVVKTSGSFLVDDNPVIGNATLFEGTTVETGKASSDLQLSGGARLNLAPVSRGKVFATRLLLEKGVGEWSGASYSIEAKGLRILADSPGSSGRVALGEDRKIQATALAGSLRVTTADGVVVALLRPGAALEFEPQAVTGAQAPFQMTGCVSLVNGRVVLKDPLTGVTEEVRGEGIEKEAGNTVEVTATIVAGAEAVPGAQEVIQVSRMRRVSRGCSAVTGPQPVPESKGMSGTKKAVIAGVAVGSAGAGALIYLETRKSGKPDSISP